MSWNHRVVRRTYTRPDGESEEVLAVHEVYYDETGRPTAITENAVAPQGETLEELERELTLFRAALEQPVLDYDDLACTHRPPHE